MTNPVMQTFIDLKDLILYGMANSTIEDLKNATLNDKCLFTEIYFGNDATIRLSKKHLPFVVKKTVNDALSDYNYTVDTVKYCFHGMNVFVSQK